jgi:hypothetical protein
VSVVRAALYARNEELALHLIALGARPDAFDAAALGDIDGLRELLDADPSRTARWSGDGFTPLHLAAWFGHPRAAELLLARVRTPKRSRRTAPGWSRCTRRRPEGTR